MSDEREDGYGALVNDLRRTPPLVRYAARPSWLWALVAVSAALAAFFAAMWLTTRSNLDTAEDELASIQAAEAERPNLRLLASTLGLDEVVEDGNRESVSLNFSGFDAVNHDSDLRGLLNDLGFNTSAVVSRIENTRALDGTLTAEGDDVLMSWTYHPDDGLNVVLELTE